MVAENAVTIEREGSPVNDTQMSFGEMAVQGEGANRQGTSAVAGKPRLKPIIGVPPSVSVCDRSVFLKWQATSSVAVPQGLRDGWAAAGNDPTRGLTANRPAF